MVRAAARCKAERGRGLARRTGNRQLRGMPAAASSPLRLAVCLLAPLCAAPLQWARPGTDPATAGRDYRQCVAEAEEALATARAIDRDILATRSEDWRRAGTLGVEAGVMRFADRRQGTAVIGRCMRDKGYRGAPPFG